MINISTNASNVGNKIPLNTFLNGSEDFVPEIKIVQGTTTSINPPSDLRPGVKRPFESSARIEADEDVILQVVAARPETYSVWNLTNVNVEDLTEYSVRIAFRSAFHNIFYSAGELSIPAYTQSYTSPDYSQLISDTVLANVNEARDHLLKNIVVQINKNSDGLNPQVPNNGSSELVMAFAVSSTGGTGVAIATLTAGTTVPIVKVNGVNGNPIVKTYTFSQEEVDSVKATYTLGTETIELADVSTATGTPSTPTDVTDSIGFIGLDRPLFLGEDRLPEIKTRIDVGLTSGFNTSLVSLTEGSKANDGLNTVRQIITGYQETQQRRDNDVQYRGKGMTVIEYPSDVLKITQPQDVVVIKHTQKKFGQLASRHYNIEETYVLTDAAVDANGVSVNTPAAGSISYGANTLAFVTGIKNWLDTNKVKYQIRYDV